MSGKEKKLESELDTVEALEKMLDDPEDSCSDLDDLGEINPNVKGGAKGKDIRYSKFKKILSRPNVPTMLVTCCSAVEVMRLRHLLVEAYHQRKALITVYTT